MPFGFIDAGGTIQRVMDIAFKGLINKSIFIYLDDITIYSRKRSSHLNNQKQIVE